MELTEAIRGSYLVNGLDDPDVGKIVRMAQRRTFVGGQNLMRQYERSTDLMVLLEGKARIVTASGEPIATIGPGAVIGEISLLDDAPRSATVIAVGDAAVAVIPADQLRALLRENPAVEVVVLRNFVKVLCAHVRLANVQLEGFSTDR